MRGEGEWMNGGQTGMFVVGYWRVEANDGKGSGLVLGFEQFRNRRITRFCRKGEKSSRVDFQGRIMK